MTNHCLNHSRYQAGCNLCRESNKSYYVEAKTIDKTHFTPCRDRNCTVCYPPESDGQA